MRQKLPRLLLLALSACAGEQTHTLSGRVLELHSGAGVAAHLQFFSPGGAFLNRECAASEDGNFKCEGLSAGHYRVDVTGPAHAPASAFLRLDADRTALLRVPRLGVISGSVATQAGTPQPAETVTALAYPSGRVAATTHTDDRGRFRLARLAPAEYVIAAGGAVSPPLRIASGESHDSVRMVIPGGPLFSISGRVTADWRGGALLLSLVQREHPAHILARTLMKPDGTFVFPAVLPGRYTILAAGPSLGNAGLAGLLGQNPVFGRAAVEVHGANANGVDVGVSQAGGLTLELAPGCASRVNAVLRSLDNWGAPWEREASVAADAAAVMDAVPPAHFALEVTDPLRQCFPALPGPLDFSDGVPRKIVLRLVRGGALEGRTEAVSTVYLWCESSPLTLLIPGSDGTITSGPFPPGPCRILSTGSDIPDPQRAVPLELHAGARTRVELPRD